MVDEGEGHPSDRWLAAIAEGTMAMYTDNILGFRCGQGVKHENLMGQDLDPGRRWKYWRLCSVPPCSPPAAAQQLITDIGKQPQALDECDCITTL